MHFITPIIFTFLLQHRFMSAMILFFHSVGVSAGARAAVAALLLPLICRSMHTWPAPRRVCRECMNVSYCQSGPSDGVGCMARRECLKMHVSTAIGDKKLPRCAFDLTAACAVLPSKHMYVTAAVVAEVLKLVPLVTNSLQCLRQALLVVRSGSSCSFATSG